MLVKERKLYEDKVTEAEKLYWETVAQAEKEREATQ